MYFSEHSSSNVYLVSLNKSNLHDASAVQPALDESVTFAGVPVRPVHTSRALVLAVCDGVVPGERDGPTPAGRSADDTATLSQYYSWNFGTTDRQILSPHMTRSQQPHVVDSCTSCFISERWTYPIHCTLVVDAPDACTIHLGLALVALSIR